MIRDIRNLLPLTPAAKADWRRVRPGGSSDVTDIAVHYMGKESFYPAADASVQDEINQAKMIHQYHINIGYGGIGYHGLGFESGRSYVTSDYNRWGANVLGHNDHILGFAGMFGGHVVPSEGVQNALADLIDHADKSYLGTSLRPIGGHRDFIATSCPGNPWEQWVPDLRALIEEDDMMTDPEILAAITRLANAGDLNVPVTTAFEAAAKQGIVGLDEAIIGRDKTKVYIQTAAELAVSSHDDNRPHGGTGGAYTDDQAVAAVKAKL